MSEFETHRKAAGAKFKTILLEPPFSFFDYIEELFGYDCNSIRRIFSLARSFHATNLIYEEIPPCGIISDENDELLEIYSNYSNPELIRISFWISDNPSNFSYIDIDGKLIGYAILKRDVVPELDFDDWHIFEAVFEKYQHVHNCTPRPQEYSLRVGKKYFSINGLMYCQQNTLNKACAQVALRSLLSRILPRKDISYREINSIAREVNDFLPGSGMNPLQIRKVLDKFDVKYFDLDYSQDETDELRKKYPYQKFAYAGLEGGNGALIGFRLGGIGLNGESKHIIPIYGHTFNKDTWAPDADISYFRIGEGFGYIPSESWTSSFLGHDDNFGPNYCIPRLYIGNDQVDYIVEIFRENVCFSGVYAEAIALDILNSLLPELTSNSNKWIQRLVFWVHHQRVVFRAVSLTSDEYVAHLSSLVGWQGDRESEQVCIFLSENLPKNVWVVEVSTPQLFPANERKVGEIVIDATKNIMSDTTSPYDVFVFARLPGGYYLGGEVDEGGIPCFTFVESNIISHTDLIRSAA